MEMLYECPFEKIAFLSRIDTNSGFGRDWDTLWKKFHDGTLVALQMKVFGHKNFQIPCTESKVPNWQFLKWHFWPRAWKLKFFVAKHIHLKCYECAIIELFHNVSQFLPNPEFVSILVKKVIFSKGHPYSISILVS